MKPLFEGLNPKYIGQPFRDVDKWVAEMKAALRNWFKVYQNIDVEAKSAKQKMDS